MTQQQLVRLNDGVDIPQLGLGVFQVPPDETESVVSEALAAGYRHIDTAAAYRNEEGVGAAIANSGIARDEIFVTTKLWNARHGFDETLRAFDESMKKLRLDVLDLYLIHWPMPHKDLYVDTFKAFIRLKEQGRIRSIGVSNFTEDHLARVIDETGVTPSVNQIEVHPDFQQRALRAFQDERGIKTESWSPLGQGKLLDHPTITAIAKKHGKSPAQAIIRWHLDLGLIVFPKSATPSRIRENLDVFDFQLDADDLGAIAQMDDPNGRDGPDPREFRVE
ncbi:aldo/keto reductase [Pelagibacterium halotolerans]|uniref:aldo/keto reductase n=1 Tax=Pelagibacterium halotolerans TaxID=531813 RepID=UPI00384FB185